MFFFIRAPRIVLFFDRTPRVVLFFVRAPRHGEKKFGIKGRALLGVSQERFNLQCLQETQATFARPSSYPHELVPSENRKSATGLSREVLHPEVSASPIGWERARAPTMANEKS